jgi:outer membrane receptor protein involved in Fe transport
MKALRQIKQAREQRLKTMLGCMIETSLGISSAMNIAHRVDFFDLDGHLILEKDPFNQIEEENGTKRLASDVAPYTASTGVSYNYQPWRVASSLNINYTPEYTRLLNNSSSVENYNRTRNERVNVDLSFTKRFDNNWSASLNARNIFSTDYKERLVKISDGSLYQARLNESIPSYMLTVEKKF